MTTEYRMVLTVTPDAKFTVFQKRTRGLEYSMSHFGDHFYIVTNKDKATNFKLMKTPEIATGKENWVDVIPHREDVLYQIENAKTNEDRKHLSRKLAESLGK